VVGEAREEVFWRLAPFEMKNVKWSTEPENER
jgi:hypothetical protein